MSKRFRGSPCAYCSVRTAASADHVIAREFFFPEDRDHLPKVPACLGCNNHKSRLEHYVSAALMVGSNLAEGNRYRREFVSKRLAKNPKIARDLGVHHPLQWLNVNGVVRPMKMLRVDAEKISELMKLITLGLYFHHFGEPLDSSFEPEVSMKHPDHEAATWASVSEFFPDGVGRVGANLGRGSFIYEGAQSPAHKGFTVWRMAWHNGINLYGENAPPQGIAFWWCVTGPTEDAVAKANGLRP